MPMCTHNQVQQSGAVGGHGVDRVVNTEGNTANTVLVCTDFI